ncbi:hypothetical protein BCR35DRAFT_13950 [Leucosporidium creatinivorum]|uniref:Uncharacterized protein n=1 Tax=Leucosporidium creatinivorum TaxID=106004 RepID=A0A1Y2FWM7_9BASI|nr:hypothetical protein BCR35DRAFT_13950 [Leucosporidium creatinivorum]
MTSLDRSPSPSPSSHGVGDQEGQEQQSDVTPQREHPPIIRPVPVTPYSICNQPQPPQQQPPWSAFVPQTSAQRSQLDSATVESPPSTYTPYQATSLHSYSPHVPPGNPAPAARVPYYHPSPYSPWTGVPSSFVGQGGRVQGSGGSTSSGSGNFIPPSHLHLSPYGYAYPPYGPPFGGAPPPPRFPPHPASVSHPNAFPSVTGQRCGFSSLEEESARRDEEQGRSAQRKRLNPSTEGEGEEVDELESDGGTQRAAVAGWGAQVQASLSGEGSLLGGEEAEETKVKKPKVTRGVQPVNPYSIPPVSCDK